MSHLIERLHDDKYLSWSPQHFSSPDILLRRGFRRRPASTTLKDCKIICWNKRSQITRYTERNLNKTTSFNKLGLPCKTSCSWLWRLLLGDNVAPFSFTVLHQEFCLLAQETISKTLLPWRSGTKMESKTVRLCYAVSHMQKYVWGGKHWHQQTPSECMATSWRRWKLLLNFRLSMSI